MDFHESILLKKGLRSDSFWTRNIVHRSSLKKIPFSLDIRALLASQYWSRGQLDALHETRLQTALQRATQVPFWRKIFAAHRIEPARATMRDFKKIPITSKKDFAEQSIEEYTTTPKDGYWLDHTSGSTGKPFRFAHDTHYALRSLAICERMFRAAGKTPRIWLVTIRARWRPGVVTDSRTFFFLKSFSSLKHRLPQLQELVRSRRGSIIIQSFSSVLIELARLSEDMELTWPLKSVIATGEGLSNEQRKRIGNALHAEVFMGYTTRELGWLGFECEHHRMHINEEWGYVEVVDEKGTTLPPQEKGRIVVTTFDNEVMPFIRYDTGDLGVIDDSPCPCGRTLKTITVTGRSVEIISLPDNRQVSLLDVAGAFDAFWNEIRQYKITQRSLTHFHITVVPRPSFESLQHILEEKIIALLHPSVRVSWEIAEYIPGSTGGKAIYFERADTV